MAEIYDPYTWTEGFFRAHRGECIHYLVEMNQLILYKLLVEDRDYDTVAVGLGAIHHALLLMFVSGPRDDALLEQTMEYMVSEAVLRIFGASYKFRDYDDDARRQQALKLFQNVEELGEGHQGVKGIRGLTAMSRRFIRDLESGLSLAQIRRSHANVFPDPHKAIESVCLSMRDGGEFLERLDPTPAGEKSEEAAGSWETAAPREAAAARAPEPAPKRRRGCLPGAVLGLILLAAIALGLCGLLFGRSLRPAAPAGDPAEAEQTAGAPGGAEEQREESVIIFPHSSEEPLDREEIENLSNGDLNRAINEIYARNGYIFRSTELREYYGQFDWYREEVIADEFTMDLLNPVERENCNLLINERNYRNE